MNRILTIITFLITSSPLFGQTDELNSLQATYERWVEAWNEKDAAAVAEISWGNFGFGRDAAFSRTGTNDKSAYEKGIGNYMQSMEVLDYEVHHSKFRVVDGIGLIDGFYAQTTKQVSGPLRTVYGRQSLVFSKRDGKWKMIHYHRSPIPNEFIR